MYKKYLEIFQQLKAILKIKLIIINVNQTSHQTMLPKQMSIYLLYSFQE